MLDHLVAREVLGAVVERPAEQQQVVDQRVRPVADVAVELHQHGVEALRDDLLAERGQDAGAVVVHLLELGLRQVLAELPLAQLLAAARRRHVGQVGVAGKLVAEPAGDEDLPRRVRQVFLRADHVRDVEVVVVDRAGQVIQVAAVRPLDDVVLLERPVEGDRPAHQVVEAAGSVARHLEADDGGTSLALEARRVGVGLRHPAPAVDEPPLLALRRLALGRRLFRRGVVAVRQSPVEQLPYRRTVAMGPLRLVVRRVRAAHLRPLVPVDAQPAEAVENRPQRRRDVAPPVGVVDAQDEPPPVTAREQPVEQRRADAAYVEVAGRARSESGANGHGVLDTQAGRAGTCRPAS